MSTLDFWHNVLEEDEELLWTGKPEPRVHWRNWRLYGSAPMAAIGLMAAAAFIVITYGTDNDMWLLLIPAVLVLIPLRATLLQLRAYASARYALTDKRALFFYVGSEQTRVKAHLLTAVTSPTVKPTLPKSIIFLRYHTEKEQIFGFDYIEGSDALLRRLEQITK